MILEQVLDIDGMKDIRDEALSKDPESISVWAQYLLEFEAFDDEFMKNSQESEVDLSWVGELACCLLKVKELLLIKDVDDFDSEEKKKIEGELLEAILKLAEEQSEDYEFLKNGTVNFNDSDAFPILNVGDFSAASNSITLSVLRELAQSNYSAAQYLLALGGSDEENWIMKAAENNYLLAIYRLGFSLSEMQPEQSIVKLEQFLWNAQGTNDGIDWNLLDDLKREAQNHIKTLTVQCMKERARAEAQKEMLAFLAHTLTNSLAGSADVLRRIAKSLTVPTADDYAMRRRATERLVGLMTSFSITESLVSSFKLYATDPQSLKAAWEKDIDGEVPLKRLIALSMRQSLCRLFFTAEHARDFARLMPGRDHREVSNTFIENALSFDLDDNEQAEQFFSWVRSELPFITLHVTDNEKLCVTRDGSKYVLIFSLISELFTNALKYSRAESEITLCCHVVEGNLTICSKNLVSGQLNPQKIGNKGLQFIEAICTLIGGVFSEPKIQNDEFSISASVPIG